MPSDLLLLVAAAIVVPLAILWRRELVMAMPLLVTLERLAVPAGASSIRVDQLAASLLCAPLAFAVVSGRHRLRMDAVAWWLVAILAVNVLSSAVNSPARAYSLVQCVNLATAWVIYVVVINALVTRDDVSAFFTRCLWAALVAGAVGIVAFVLALAGLHVGGAEVSRSAAEFQTSAYGAFGTMVEPNLFGSFMGAYFVIAIALVALAPRDDDPQRALVRWLVGVCAVGLVVSFTRAAWLGVIVMVIGFAILGRTRVSLRTSRVLLPVAVMVGAVAVIALLPGDIGSLLRFKIGNLVNPTSQTASSRILTAVLAVQQSLAHPLIGWGTFTYAPLITDGADFTRIEGWRNLWIGNYLILALHDTGVIGLALWCGMLWTVLTRGVKTSRTLMLTDRAAGARALAITLGAASLLIPFLSTSGFSLAFPWLLIGLLGAHARLAEQALPEPEPMPAAMAPPLIPLDAT